MKITPQQYAQVLIASLEKGNSKDIAKSFWHKLQRNGLYKDLPKIINELEKEFAKINNKILIKVYSEKILGESQIKEIKDKLLKKLGKESILKNIVVPNQTAGITVKMEDIEIDLSVDGKLKKLKQVLIS